jgi:FkbM family methyltransferase
MKKLIYTIARKYSKPLSLILSHTFYKAGIINPNIPSIKWILHQTGIRLIKTINLPTGEEFTMYGEDTIGQKITTDGIYEPEIARLLEHFLKPGMTFFDIGAHVGIFSLLAARLVGVGGQVHSFEADPWTFSLLKRNVERNHLRHVTANNLAVSDAEGTVSLVYDQNQDFGGNSIAPTDSNVMGAIQVPAVSLDAYLGRKGISDIDCIKADIEGAEYLMLKGGERLFAQPNRPTLIMEINEFQLAKIDTTPQDIYRFLRKFGYYIYKLDRLYTDVYKHNRVHENVYNILATIQEMDNQKQLPVYRLAE